MSVGGFTEKAKDDLVKMEANAEKLRRQISQIEFPNIDKPEKMKNGFNDLYKSAKKFALGILSVRTAYTIISKASSSYLATDEKTTNQLEANWVGLGTIMEPVIKFIIDLMKKAVTSVLYFMSALTGVDYIAKANANALKKQENATNSLKKANDRLTASFDEMEVLSAPDTSNVGTGSSIDTSVLFDITDIGEDARKTIEKIAKELQPVYEILKQLIDWSLENPDVVLGILGGVALLDTLLKINGVIGTGTKAGTGLLGIYGALKMIVAIGTVGVVLKVNSEIQSAQKNLDDFVTGMDKIIKTYDGYIIQMKLKFEEEPTQENFNTVDMLLKKKRDTIQSEIDQLKSSLTWYLWVFDPAGYMDIKDKIKQLEKQLQGVNTEIKNNSRDSKIAISDAKVGVDGIKSNLGDTFDKKWSLNIDELEAKKKIQETSDELGFTFNKNYPINVDNEDAKTKTSEVQNKLNTVYDKEYELKSKNNSALEDVKTVDSFLNTTFGKKYEINTNKINAISSANEIGKKLDTEITKKRKIDIDADTTNANSKFKNLFNGFGTKLTTVFGSLGLNLTIPKLATGGIINNPGRGVPLGGAIGGEVNKEGVIPLTDSQAMEELGQTIGKYININLTNITQLNNRQIAREQKKINAQNDFAMNK